MTTFKAAIVLAICISMCNAAVYNKTFDSVEEIDSAFSFPGTINATAGSITTTVMVNAPQSVIDALDINLSDGTLNLGLKQGSSVDVSTATFNLTVPAGSIDELDTAGSGRIDVDASIADDDDTFTLSASGSGSVFFNNATVDEVDIQQSGSGMVVVAGSPSELEVSVSGSGTTYIVGVEDTVKVQISGSGNVYVDGQGNNVDISGQASGSASVSYTSGSCSISGFGNVCNSVNSITTPS